MDASSDVGSAPTPSIAVRMQHGDSSTTSMKRGLDQLSSRNRSPPVRRIKTEPIDSDPMATFENSARELTPPLPTTELRLLRTTVIGPAFVIDPLKDGDYWQILCTGTKLGRRRLCSYLGFGIRRSWRIGRVGPREVVLHQHLDVLGSQGSQGSLQWW
jgi:hypothetical protein